MRVLGTVGRPTGPGTMDMPQVGGGLSAWQLCRAVGTAEPHGDPGRGTHAAESHSHLCSSPCPSPTSHRAALRDTRESNQAGDPCNQTLPS